MENQKKSKGTTALVILLLIVTVAALVLATYAWARYTSTLDNATGTVEVAKWNVTAGNSTATFSKTYTKVVEGKMAPGTSGSFDAAIDVTGTEVDVAYKITILSVTNKPTNLKFYSDERHNEEINLTDINNGGVQVGDVQTIPAGSTTTTGTATIYWNWPYQTGAVNATTGVAEGDAADTTDGVNKNNMEVTYRIDAWQVQPE